MSFKLDAVPPLPAIRRRLKVKHPYEPDRWVKWKARQWLLVLLFCPTFVLYFVTRASVLAVFGTVIAWVAIAFGIIADYKRE